MGYLRSGLLTLLEPVLARSQDQLAGALRVEVGNVREVVHGLLREILAGHDAVAGELAGERVVPALDCEQGVRGIGADQRVTPLEALKAQTDVQMRLAEIERLLGEEL